MGLCGGLACGVECAPFGRLLHGAGQLPGKEVVLVQKHLLKECISALKQLRDAKHGELDASIVGELDEVIAQVEVFCEAEDDEVAIGPLGQSVVSILGRAAESFVAEIIKAWFDND